MGDRFTTYLNYEIGKINLHLPKKLLNLSLILKMKEPGFINRKGEFVPIEEEEIEFVKENIPEQFFRRFEVPIMLTRRRALGDGLYVISGNEPNVYIIRKCLNESLESYDKWRLKPLRDTDRYVYNYELPKIRRKLRSMTIHAFA